MEGVLRGSLHLFVMSTKTTKKEEGRHYDAVNSG
jgi:hypothetical protein